MKLILQLSVRNILRNKRRNAMLFAAIAVAVACVAGMNTIIRGFQADMMEGAVENLTGHIKLYAPGYRDDPSIEHGFELAPDFAPEAVLKASEVDEPQQHPEILGWAPRVRIPGVIMSERETRGVQLVGIDPAAEEISFLADVPFTGEQLTSADDKRVFIGKELAKQLETEVGRRIVVISQGPDGRNRERGYRVAGLFDADGTGLEKLYVFTGLHALQGLLDSEQMVTEISIRLREEPASVSYQAALEELFNQLEVLSWQQLNPQAAAMFLFADGAIYIWFVMMMSALTFGLINTLIASVMERVKELGMLRALGMRKRTVIAQVVVESTIVMAIGVACGLLLGFLLYLSVADGIDLSSFAEGMEMAGMRNLLVPRLWISDVVQVAAMSLVLGVIASLYPAWRAVALKPLEALRT